MHILIIPSEGYVPIESPLLGIFQYHQANTLVKSGHKIGVVSPYIRSARKIFKFFKSSIGLKIEILNNIPVYRFNYWNIFPRVRFVERLIWLRSGMVLFEKYVQNEGQPDIIHAHNAFFAGLLAQSIRKKYNIPYVITEHSSVFARKMFPTGMRGDISSVYNNASQVIAVSESLKNVLLQEFSVNKNNIEVIPNLLDETFETKCWESSNNKKEGTGNFVFLNVASLDENKAHADLLKAFGQAFHGQQNIQLRIGGDGPLKQKLQELSIQYGIDKQVHFLGLLPREQVFREMENCNVFILSSHYETFGVVLIEAMARGKPVISTASGGPNHIVTKDNGLLVPIKNISALAKAMEKMISDYTQYEELYIRQACLAKYGQSSIINRLNCIYSKIV